MAYSGQERIAFEAGKEDGIFGRPRENPYNMTTALKSWRAYEEGYDEGEGSTIPPRGPAGPKGDPGEQGSQGIPGLNGQDGADGLSFLQGVGPPAAGLGKVGDTYLDTSTQDIYNKTGSTTWTLVANVADVAELAQEVDDEGSLIYIGTAQPGSATASAVWRLKRITITIDGSGREDLKTEYADGDNAFNNVWDNRAAASYS